MDVISFIHEGVLCTYDGQYVKHSVLRKQRQLHKADFTIVTHASYDNILYKASYVRQNKPQAQRE